MAVQEILQLGDPRLWEKAQPVEDPTSKETAAIIRDLDDTLAAFRISHGRGRGIAAPQIGVLKRILFVRMAPTGFVGPLINPEIVWADPEQIELWDDCFSFPDLMVKVRRAARVRVAYTDANGERLTLEAEGDISELLQHEIDHLDGILAVQRAISPTALATRAQWEKMQTWCGEARGA